MLRHNSTFQERTPERTIEHSSFYGWSAGSIKGHSERGVEDRAKMLELKMKISKRQEMISFYREELKRREERNRR